ncbi:metallophosphoesterase family protein [Mangrovibrevibacter kandeliae]|uniref:metallophosphoesterase family protein n=1 Tax=Mangrovibrevibacter kandeliae TaxID=2968473 RepID=UPI002117CE66|nr:MULTISPECIES: metallophosphoesterase [unclassified Aurantimonas]MCQ8780990.1 metallophosphoesterase [Aurantimonas sp. CSK15Z-1]MCW4113770.1 metallophosphoesterase [Aurantimonas sp. MSK8Z-1]
MFKLAHLSDIHLGPLPDLSLRELASKRVTGFVNWHRNRSRTMFGDVLTRLVNDMKGQCPDHVAVTGDLVNLATRQEITAARLWLESLGSAQDVSLVPGNHDAYVPGALKRVSHEWHAYMIGDNPLTAIERAFPYLRVRGNVALFGVSSAEATAPFLATGTFRRGQAIALARLLESCRSTGHFRVVMIHHPPVIGAAAWSKRLIGKQLFSKLIREIGADLVLHGHTHLDTLHWLPGPDGTMVPVVGVPSASQSAGAEKPAARYNLFEIEGEPHRWTLTQRERGERPDGSGIDWIRERVIERAGRLIDIRPHVDAPQAQMET